MKLPLRVLFLCTGNSCRSIIAEALANHLGAGRLEAFSAGSQPTGEVNPNALKVLARHQIPVGEVASQSWDEFADQAFDLVVTVCDNAAGESCPVWLGKTLKAHWGVADPAPVQGDDETVARAFERTLRALEVRLEALLALPLATLKPAELVAALGDIQQRLSHTFPG
jgi:arsenate reductase (thioredoxin)